MLLDFMDNFIKEIQSKVASEALKGKEGEHEDVINNKMNTPSYRLLATVDIPAAQRLRELAGWNQTDQDWKNLLALEPHGCFAAELRGRVVGTATTTRFEPSSGPGSFGWVGMVLVDPECRRLGIGSGLLNEAINYLKRCGVETIKLDATPQGKLVYEKLGFRAEYELERFEAVSPEHATPSAKVEPICVGDLEEICGIDTIAFGARRQAILKTWLDHWPEISFCVREQRRIVGFALARRGTHFHQLGPVVSADPALCEILLTHQLAQLKNQKVIMDVVTANERARPIAEKLGFKPQRPLLRMALGPNLSPGHREQVFAICCPEIG
jgi:GNAT superfamily N-acetyltransferase